MHFVRGDFPGHRVATQRAQRPGALRPLRLGVQRRRHADGPSAGRNPPGQTGGGRPQTITRTPAATACGAATVRSAAAGTIRSAATVTPASAITGAAPGAANFACRGTAAGHTAHFGRDARGIHAQ